MGADAAQGTVHFYFWNHDNTLEILTPGAKHVASTAPTLYLEGPLSHDDRRSRLFNASITQTNEHLARGNLRKALLAAAYQMDSDEGGVISSLKSEKLMLMCLRGRNRQRLQFERSHEYPFDHVKEIQNILASTFNDGIDAAISAMHAFFTRATPYLDERENMVVEDLLAIPGDVGVFFGIAHAPLEKRVAEHRPTTFTLSYPACDMAYHDYLWNKYRETGDVDRTLFLRALWESIVNHAVDKTLSKGTESQRISTGTIQFLTPHIAAHHITPELVPEYINYYNKHPPKQPSPSRKAHLRLIEKFLKQHKQPTIMDCATAAAQHLEKEALHLPKRELARVDYHLNRLWADIKQLLEQQLREAEQAQQHVKVEEQQPLS